MTEVGKQALIGSLALLLVVAVVPSVQAAETTPRQVTREYTRSLNTGETEPVLNVLHPASPQREKTRRELQRLNRMYDLEHTLEELEVLDQSDSKARVRFVHHTRAEDPSFRENRYTGIHVLRKHKGIWKIYETRTVDIEYLEESGD